MHTRAREKGGERERERGGGCFAISKNTSMNGNDKIDLSQSRMYN